MKKFLFILTLPLLHVACVAQEPPIFGFVEQIPVLNEDQKIVAKPLYLFTDRQVTAPTVFSALRPTQSAINVACCFEVADLTPLSLQGELKKYASDENFAPLFKGIKGYRFIYKARPVSKEKWSPAMKAAMVDMADPSDLVPFSMPIIGATFPRAIIPATFQVNGKSIGYRTSYPANSEKVVYVFTMDGRRIEFSQTTMIVEGK